ncbi:unnamed protein product [Larinioides sclopetarius]|uniref:Uncharacterized protein n=1 Tax=Larinioides sclopetarius TaxID=280406 RepID=A0AAV2A5Y9_9ARAC
MDNFLKDDCLQRDNCPSCNEGIILPSYKSATSHRYERNPRMVDSCIVGLLVLDYQCSIRYSNKDCFLLLCGIGYEAICASDRKQAINNDPVIGFLIFKVSMGLASIEPIAILALYPVNCI